MANHNNVLTYKFNKNLMAEIEILKLELLDRFKAGKAPSQVFVSYMRKINQLKLHESPQNKLCYENANPSELDFNQLLQVLLRKQYALEHGKCISRGKAYAKQQRELNKLTKAGV